MYHPASLYTLTKQIDRLLRLKVGRSVPVDIVVRSAGSGCCRNGTDDQGQDEAGVEAGHVELQFAQVKNDPSARGARSAAAHY